ncbi:MULTISPECIES: type IV pilus biogenesis/stability protein PilW [unclassified Aliivibrio]|jgi:type IV pilus assembly protein PilF|uniref:type IV pilus biogenesis/stability protein PilW n=1 Tax=unclassified Aliivibrio TaxID=2645654 RepID=UPI00080E55B6|nr:MULTISPECIES: type IV pilus biogenesis/stability protein PilW [unclassified Aliivibrio]OCH14889.1 type IV pilus biogenesis/stability protein PilW [Aliivibrio sp. 1S128]OCH16222.1 type IV pilus biogenesis/stability protein PilW [Aliivibrio sp. 1S165]OCH33830.1 type IV pilus biogenesis/stability protein PilW [Aliivibrio sp. 1S175]
MRKWRVALLTVSLLVSAGCVTVNESDEMTDAEIIRAAEARVTLGLSYLNAGNMIKARENLELAVRYAPDYYRSQTSLAYYYQQVDENELAEKAYKRALRSSSKNGNVLNNYGVFLCKNGRYEEAQQKFTQAIDQPYYYLVSASYENAAMCALGSGDKVTAKTYFERSLAHDPNRVRSTLQLAKLNIDEGNYSEPRIALFKFTKKYGYKPVSLSLLIELEKKAGNAHLVKKYADLLGKKYPDSREYQNYLNYDS